MLDWLQGYSGHFPHMKSQKHSINTLRYDIVQANLKIWTEYPHTAGRQKLFVQRSIWIIGTKHKLHQAIRDANHVNIRLDQLRSWGAT